jgi:hypothetical protein
MYSLPRTYLEFHSAYRDPEPYSQYIIQPIHHTAHLAAPLASSFFTSVSSISLEF